MEMMMDLAKFELHQQQHLSHSILRAGGDNHPTLIPHKKKEKKKLLLSTNAKLVADFPSPSHSQFSISRRQTRKSRVPTIWVVPESKEDIVEFQNGDALLEIAGEIYLVKEAGVGKEKDSSTIMYEKSEDMVVTNAYDLGGALKKVKMEVTRMINLTSSYGNFLLFIHKLLRFRPIRYIAMLWVFGWRQKFKTFAFGWWKKYMTVAFGWLKKFMTFAFVWWKKFMAIAEGLLLAVKKFLSLGAR
nr:uncharacterized protein LOC107418112 isoform X1 [Ziziphus jujuba var. spinosa]